MMSPPMMSPPMMIPKAMPARPARCDPARGTLARAGASAAAGRLAAALAACTGPVDTENALEGMIATEQSYETEGAVRSPADATAPGVGIEEDAGPSNMGAQVPPGEDTFEQELGSDAQPGQPIPDDGGR